MSATVHRHRSACRAGAAAAGVVLFLAGCGGGDSRDGAAASPAATTAAETSPSGDADFCEQAADIDHRVDAAVSDLGPDSSLPDAVSQLTAELRAIEAPDAIAADWNALASGLDRLADAIADVDLSDPSTFDALDQAGSAVSAAGDRVDAYLREQCGITP
jgi:ABC-type glycerol-3-phosphate transport system substrate-binding protein